MEIKNEKIEKLERKLEKEKARARSRIINQHWDEYTMLDWAGMGYGDSTLADMLEHKRSSERKPIRRRAKIDWDVVHQQVIEAVGANGGISRRELAEVVDVKPSTLGAKLKEWVDAGEIAREGIYSASKYFPVEGD